MKVLRWTAAKNLIPVAAAIALAGCFDSGDPTTTLQGIVIDGPVISAEVIARDATGKVIATTTTGADARYTLSFNNNDIEFPISITVSDGLNLVTGDAPSFPLEALLMSPSDEAVTNITPFSTLVASIATRMSGGTSEANVDAARQYVNDSLGFGIGSNADSSAASGDELAELVLASEAITEALRRTSAALITSGSNLDPEAVMASLAADMVDGVIDGEGAAGADPRVAAVASVAAAQVLIETITTGLQIGNLDGTQALDQALQQITGGDPSLPSTGELPVSQELLDQAAQTVALASQFNNDPALDTLAQRLETVRAEQTPAELEPMLPAGSGNALQNALSDASSATNNQIQAALENSGGAPPAPAPEPTPEPAPAPAPEPAPQNSAPRISGSPARQIDAGSSYSFTPSASDTDGDELEFSITNKPDWASFSVSSGRLSGTPDDGDVRSYNNIRISVSDGPASATLAAFSITVNAVEAPPVEPLATQIVVHHDGDIFDKDDIAALPIVALLVDKAELNAVTTLAYNNNILGGTSNGQVAAMRNSAAFAESLGIDTVDYEASAAAATAAVVAIYNSGSPVISIEGGPMEAVYRALSQTDADKLQNITLVSHSNWNENFNNSGSRTWTDVKAAFPDVSFVDIKDQNPGFNSSGWSWMDNAVDSNIQAARAAMLGADDKFNDASDAGMVYWYLTGNEDGTPADAQNYLGAEVAPPSTPPSVAFYYSTSSSLSNPQPLNGATLTGPAYLLVLPDADIDVVSFSNGRSEGQAPFEWLGYVNGQPQADEFAEGEQSITASVTFNGGASTGIQASFSVDLPEQPAPNLPPTISGNASNEIAVGSNYSFTPSASDPENAELSFSIVNKPDWASFDSGNGRLSGSPGNNDVGSYANIRISVFDGENSVQLPAFTIDVLGTATASLSLSWLPPTSNADGTTLTDLGGYRIYYGVQSGDYPNQVEIGAGITSYVIDGLAPDTYYLVMTAVDSAGNESQPTGEASATLP